MFIKIALSLSRPWWFEQFSGAVRITIGDCSFTLKRFMLENPLTSTVLEYPGQIHCDHQQININSNRLIFMN